METCLKNIGANIRVIRKKRKMTIEELSDKSGLSAKYLQGVETAKNNISVINLENISRALDVSLTDIIETNNEAFRDSEEKMFHLAARLKRYNNNQLSFVYEMLDIIDGFKAAEGTTSFLIPPKFSQAKKA